MLAWVRRLFTSNDSSISLVTESVEQFIPIKDFFSPEFRSQYVTGLPYTIRIGNIKLHELAHKWEGQGLVKITRVTEASKLRGQGGA